MAGGEADSAAKPGEGEDQANAPDGGSTRAPPGATRRDGKIDPEELGSVFQELKHRIKKVPALARSPPLRDPSIVALPTDATPA